MCRIAREAAAGIVALLLALVPTVSAEAEDIDPCAGISREAIVTAFNRHGVRLGGPSGVPLTAVAFSQLSEHIVGCGQRCGPCTGLLTIADPQGRMMTVQENVVPRRGTLDDFDFTTVQDLHYSPVGNIGDTGCSEE